MISPLRQKILDALRYDRRSMAPGPAATQIAALARLGVLPAAEALAAYKAWHKERRIEL